MKSTEIQDQINAIDADIQAGAPQGQIDRLNDQKTDLEKQLNAALADETSQAERAQAQAEAVKAIVLPLDFNALFDNTAANDTIIEVVREFQSQAYADHNTEIAQVNAEWQSKLQATTESVTAQLVDLQKRLDTELLQGQEDAKEIIDLQQQVAQLTIEKKDAESKRDAAANELKDANAEIYRLTQLIAAPAPEQKPIEIATNDRLTELAAKAKQSAADSAARAVARWNESNPTLAVPALEIPSLPQVNAEPAAVPTPTEIPSDTGKVEGNGTMEQVVGAETQAVVIPVTLESLKAEVEAIKAHIGMVA